MLLLTVLFTLAVNILVIAALMTGAAASSVELSGDPWKHWPKLALIFVCAAMFALMNIATATLAASRLIEGGWS